MKKLLPVCSLLLLSFASLQAQIISTVAGTGTAGFSGDGGQATAADLYYPNAVGFDNAGNMYIADENNERIRKVDASGNIITIAGTGSSGYSGDGGPATAANLFAPEGVWADKAGNIYIADLVNERIRKVNTSGIISTFAGIGSFGFSGDGGPATAAELASPYRIVTDTVGNFYIADQGTSHIRKINTSGIISTVAGNGTSGYSGDGGQATDAELKYPYSVAVDNIGNIYIADAGNQVVRMVNTLGIISTYAGNGTAGFSGDGGPATAAQMSSPFAVAVDALGNVYVDDQGNQRIRVIDPLGNISTVAGTGTAGYNGDGIAATAAEINDAWDVTVDAAGNLFISDEVNQRVRMVPAAPLGMKTLNNELSVHLYPDPNNGEFTMQMNGVTENGTLEIYNVLGDKVHSEVLPAAHFQSSVNIRNQPAGIYFYRITNAGGKYAASGKFVIE